MKRLELRDGSRLTIAAPTADDAERLLDFANAVGGESDYLTFGKGEFDMTVEDEVKFIETAEEKGHLMLKGEIGGELVSILHVSRGPRPRVRHVGELGITVRQSSWGLGVGRHMMEAMLDWARESGLRKVNLKVRWDNARAIALYESLGFVQEGRQARGYLFEGAFFDEICMGLVID
jgi:RimJ/RimL family protein N-acetyltransferase